MKYLISFIALFLVFSTKSTAQTNSRSVNAEINIEATVIQAIEMVTAQNIQLANLEPVNNEIFIPPATSGNAGHMIASGNPNAEIRITFQPNQILNQINGDGLIRVIYQLTGNDIDEQLTSEVLGAENRSFSFNADGDFYIWVGGRVFVEQAKPGSYEGEFTIEIDYI